MSQECYAQILANELAITENLLELKALVRQRIEGIQLAAQRLALRRALAIGDNA